VLDVTALFVFVGLVHRASPAGRFPPPLRRAAALSAGFGAVIAPLPLLGLAAGPAMLAFAVLTCAFGAASWRGATDATDRAAVLRLLRRRGGVAA
jgi:hypothetical protein